MTTLQEVSLQYNNMTDKDTGHSYITYAYSDLFSKFQNKALKVLEIGVYSGGSLLIWKDFFCNATIYGIDIDVSRCHHIDDDRIKIIEANAYDMNFVSSLPDNFDIIIDDGPHTLDSMIFSVENYTEKLHDSGILVVEDIQDISWIETLISHTKPQLRDCIKTIDLRNIKNRYDDLLFIIDKRLK